MRPQKLTMQAFGSYGKHTEISFEEPNQNLFLITGDTGSGKTTVFDAIVFALYGEAGSSYNKKEGQELQSQFAGLETEPFVELTFQNGGQQYTVRRTPRHVRPLKRGSGIKEESGSVSLLMPDGTEYPPKETDRKLEEILGLTKSQFMQVAMIAQGEFMNVLRAKSDEKKVIFRKLFHTEIYQKISDELAGRRKEKEGEMARIRTACQTEVSHVNVPEEYGQREEMERLKAKIVGADRMNVTDLEAMQEMLGQLCEFTAGRQNAAQREWLEICQKRDRIKETYTKAEQLAGAFEQLDTAWKELQDCQENEKEIQGRARMADRVLASWEVRTEYQRYQDAAGQVDAARKALEQQKQEMPGLEEKVKSTAAEQQAAKMALELEQDRSSRIAERVRKAMEAFDSLKQTEKKQAEAEKTVRDAAERAAQQEQKRLEFDEKEQQWRKQLEGLGGITEQQALCAQKEKEAQSLEENAQEVGRLRDAVKVQQNLARSRAVEYQRVKQAYEGSQRRYETLRQRFLDAQAGILARELKPGIPCPVCGALEHPNPCAWIEAQEDGEEISRTALETLAQETEKLRQDQEKLSRESGEAAKVLDEKKKNYEKAGKKLRSQIEKNKEDLEHIPEALTVDAAKKVARQWRNVLEEQKKQLDAKTKQAEQLRSSLSTVDAQKKELQSASEEAGKAYTEAAAALQGISSQMQKLKEMLEYEDEVTAKKALRQAGEQQEQVRKIYEKAERQAELARTKRDHGMALIGKYEQEIPVQQRTVRERQESYQAVMEKHHLTEEVWKQAAEAWSKEEAKEWQEQAQQHRERKVAVQARIEAADKLTAGMSRPDLKQIKGLLEEAEQQKSRAEEQLEQAKVQYRENTGVYEALMPQMEQRRCVVEEYGSLDRLYRMVSGNISGARMDLETFAQRYYLERILEAANVRFQEMSAGQFELRLYDLKKAGEGKNRGLDLMVYSYVTGKEREVRTLSGGESFMAALSLALGMADQIQENAAAIDLDMMFIDEGFGSLDEHSREQAVRVLQRMAGGSRMVGIISHVSELKQEIEDQLIVSKDESGSHVRWQIS